MLRHVLNAIPIALMLSGGQPMSAKSQVVVPPKPGSGFMGFSWDPIPGRPLRVADGLAGLPPVAHRPFPMITRVFPCSPADSAGVSAGDVMLRINGRDAREVPPPFNKSRPGVWQEITLRRQDDTMTVRLKEVKRPVEPVHCEKELLGSNSRWQSTRRLPLSVDLRHTVEAMYCSVSPKRYLARAPDRFLAVHSNVGGL